jgi:hypothetical protein
MEYLFLIALGWFLQEFEPIKLAGHYFYEKTNRKPIIEYILGVFDCWQCSTFWGALIVTWDFKQAVIASFLTFVIEMIHEIWMLKRNR